MGLVQLTKGYRISDEDVVAMISVSDLNNRMEESERAKIQESVNVIIEKAEERGVYFQFSRKQDSVKTVLILRNGMVFGTSVAGDTILNNMGIEKKRTAKAKRPKPMITKA